MADVLRLHLYGGHTHDRRSPSFKAHNGARDIYKAIMGGKAFQAGNMSGTPRNVPTTAIDDLGVLPDKYRERIVQDQPDYIVASYGTPIAWHYTSTDDGEEGKGYWVVPDVKYSATTSRHQGVARTALVFAEVESYDE